MRACFPSSQYRRHLLTILCFPLISARARPLTHQVKSLKTPPKGVKLTMEVCCIMFDVKPNKVKDPESGKKVRAFNAFCKSQHV